MLSLFISLISFCKCQGDVLSGGRLDTCEGSIALITESGDPRVFSKADIIESQGAFKGFYVEHGEREGTCCFRLRNRRRYSDISRSGQHEIRMKIRKIEIVECVAVANILIPVLCTALGLILAALVIIVVWRRKKGAGRLPVPTQEPWEK